MGRSDPKQSHRDGQKISGKERRVDSRAPIIEPSPSHSRHSIIPSHTLSADALARLNREATLRDTVSRRHASRRRGAHEADGHEPDRQRDRGRNLQQDREQDRNYGRHRPERTRRSARKNRERTGSGRPLVDEKITKLRGGSGSDDIEQGLRQDRQRRKRRCYGLSPKQIWIIAGVALGLVIVVIIVVAVVVSRQGGGSSGPVGSVPTASQSGLAGLNHSSIPAQYQGTYLDPWTWYDTTGFNVTFTTQTIGDLPMMGLLSEWDDSAAANPNVPAINQAWGSYGSRPARGVNLGGWLSLEPFITPSLFQYDASLGVVDEWTLCKHLGAAQAATVLEKHYAEFVSESTFAAIADAGLDHVRIPFSYWAVQTYDSDPYVFRTSWRYLLRGMEWARKYGLRVNLDLHGLPGSQNGWNHSGRLGPIGWLNGTSGTANAQRSIDIHSRLSQFLAQPRYRNLLSHYGLANEPRMVDLVPNDVIAWTEQAYDVVRQNGIEALVIFGDGFMGLEKWRGVLTGLSGLVLDAHQYVIFNPDQIDMLRHDKVTFACTGWSQQAQQSLDPSTGFGPTLFGEWSQADTDCAQYLTNVGWGNRWTGTLVTGNATMTPRCPTLDARCACRTDTNPADFSDSYRQFLLLFAQAQMHSFELGWGWWYWNWDTESAPLWSYRQGLAAGILPAKAYDRSFDCSQAIPTWPDEPEYQ